MNYAYHPCSDAVLSIHELSGRSWMPQDKKRVLHGRDIVSGADHLGVLLMGHEKNAYWLGSVLENTEAQALNGESSATSLQVVAGVIAGMKWAIANPRRGIVEAEDMDFEFVLQAAEPYLGKIVGRYTEWTPTSTPELFQRPSSMSGSLKTSWNELRSAVMGYVKSHLGLKSHDWSSTELLRDLCPESITGCRSTIESRREHFWHDMSSEFDSKHLLLYLLRRCDLTLSDEFLEFVCLWHLDEQNHYRGLRKINSVLYGMSEHEIDEIILSRQPDFASVNEFLQDEFTILASIAFDEVTSTRAYKQDFALFDSIGPDCLSTWIRNAAKDEAAHYGNAMKLLKLNHSHRFSELPSLLDKIVEFETDRGFSYHNTFIFDHDTDDFTDELLQASRTTILEVLRRDA